MLRLCVCTGSNVPSYIIRRSAGTWGSTSARPPTRPLPLRSPPKPLELTQLLSSSVISLSPLLGGY